MKPLATVPANARVPGVTAAELDIVRQLIGPNTKIWIFGSRAKGTHKKFSDLDVCFDRGAPLPDAEVSLMREKFQNSDLPYKVDLIDYHDVSEDFRKLIRNSSIELEL